MSKPSLHLETDPEALAVATRDLVAQLVHEAVRQRGRFSIALSGGSTPKRFHQLLAKTEGLPWASMHFFFGDERHVGPEDPQSNYRMAQETLLSLVPVPAENVHRVEAEDPDAQRVATRYGAELRRFFGDAEAFPRFDVQLLGLGPDGHTASLFPGVPEIHESTRWVAAPWVAKLNTFRITLTPPVLNASRAVVFLVQGADKADAVQEVFEGTKSVNEIPSKVVQPNPGGAFWFLDAAAAAKLSDASLGRKKVRG